MHKYILQETIGTGGYAQVHKAIDPLGIRYACKVLPKSKNKQARVQSEIEILKHLSDHTMRVPRYIDACEDDTSYYIIQEFCKGGVIQEYSEKMTENTIASFMRGILRSLAHIHSQKVIHGDIKSNNIFLADKSEEAEVKIGDFGTAMWCFSDYVSTPYLIGTPWFMAPENLGHRYYFQSDVWSVGVLAAQLLSGKMPFNDRNNPIIPSIPAIWYSIMNDDISKKVQNIEEGPRDFIMMCLERDPEKRASAEEALKHQWLLQTDCKDRFVGTPLLVEPFVYHEYTRTFHTPHNL